MQRTHTGTTALLLAACAPAAMNWVAPARPRQRPMSTLAGSRALTRGWQAAWPPKQYRSRQRHRRRDTSPTQSISVIDSTISHKGRGCDRKARRNSQLAHKWPLSCNRGLLEHAYMREGFNPARLETANFQRLQGTTANPAPRAICAPMIPHDRKVLHPAAKAGHSTAGP